MSVQLWDCLSGVLRKEDFQDVTQIGSLRFLTRQRKKKLYLFWPLTTMQPKKWVLENVSASSLTSSPLLYEVTRFVGRRVNQLALLPLPQLTRKTSTSDLARKSTGWPMTTKCSSENMKYKTQEPQRSLVSDGVLESQRLAGHWHRIWEWGVGSGVSEWKGEVFSEVGISWPRLLKNLNSCRGRRCEFL